MNLSIGIILALSLNYFFDCDGLFIFQFPLKTATHKQILGNKALIRDQKKLADQRSINGLYDIIKVYIILLNIC